MAALLNFMSVLNWQNDPEMEMISSEPYLNAKRSTVPPEEGKPKLNHWMFCTDPWVSCGRWVLPSSAYPHLHHLSRVCNNSVVLHYQFGSWQLIIKNMLRLLESLYKCVVLHPILGCSGGKIPLGGPVFQSEETFWKMRQWQCLNHCSF